MTLIRVLHVEDEIDHREIVAMALGHPDFETRSCGSGQEALAIAIDWSPDIILLDVAMPPMGWADDARAPAGQCSDGEYPGCFLDRPRPVPRRSRWLACWVSPE